MIDVNLKGGFLVSKAAIPHMKQQGGGVILFTGSEMGFIADPAIPVYVASKGGVHMLMKAMAISLIKHNIRVNAFCPGETNTPLLQSEIDNSTDPGGHQGVIRRVGADRAHGGAARTGVRRTVPRV